MKTVFVRVSFLLLHSLNTWQTTIVWWNFEAAISRTKYTCRSFNLTRNKLFKASERIVETDLVLCKSNAYCQINNVQTSLYLTQSRWLQISRDNFQEDLACGFTLKNNKIKYKIKFSHSFKWLCLLYELLLVIAITLIIWTF